MKRPVLCICFFVLSATIFAQHKWFGLYTDSVKLVSDASNISEQFIAECKKIAPAMQFNPRVILNTQPALIFYEPSNNTVNLPLWEQLISDIQGFIYKVAGGEEPGREVFGLFFNGFYLAHELGHAVRQATGKNESAQGYADEWLANTIAILYWKKTGHQQELDSCYVFAKSMHAQLPNPVPVGKTIEQFFTENYAEATQNPFTYGYMQFGQFIKIYEDKTLPDFNTFMRRYLKTDE